MFFKRARRGLLLEINPFQMLAAGVAVWDERPVELDCAQEFAADDFEGFARWLKVNLDVKPWLPAHVSFFPADRLLQRDTIQPRKLAEPGYLTRFAEEQLKIANPAQWVLHAISPHEGTTYSAEGAQRPALVCGAPTALLRKQQQQLLELGIVPHRLELGTLPAIASLTEYQARKNDKRALVLVEMELEKTYVYILGKEGVHTTTAIPHGFAALEATARKEFGLAENDSPRERLANADDELLLRAPKLLRPLSRDLKPLLDSYEMTTGQPIGEIYCAHLPAAYQWMASTIAQGSGRAMLELELPRWLVETQIKTGGLPAFTLNWFGVLSLAADLTPPKPDAQSA
jgi:hypothetical protein